MAAREAEPDLSWVVVCHDSTRDLGVFLPSLQRALASLGRCGFQTELLLVDNASTDGTAEAARRLGPRAVILRNARNQGYGQAANRAARLARGRWLAVSNADLFVPRNGLEQLPTALAHQPSDVALLGPALFTTGGAPAPSAGSFPTLRRLLSGLARGASRRKYVSLAGHRRGAIDWVTGACLFVRRDVFDSIGGFDPDYFLYYEEVDLARRLHLRGHRAKHLAEVQLMHVRPHHGRPARGETEGHVRRGRQLYFGKHRPPWERRVLAWLMALEPALRPRVRRTLREHSRRGSAAGLPTRVPRTESALQTGSEHTHASFGMSSRKG